LTIRRYDLYRPLAFLRWPSASPLSLRIDTPEFRRQQADDFIRRQNAFDEHNIFNDIMAIQG
jgi:hypothetical protein